MHPRPAPLAHRLRPITACWTASLACSIGGPAHATGQSDPELPPVTVSAFPSPMGSATEGSGSYLPGTPLQSATGLLLEQARIPQPTTVITRQQLDDQRPQALEDLVAVAPGLTLSRNQFYARGFAVEALMLDGVAATFDKTVDLGHSLALYDRIELVRGASSLLQGAGNPSATLNLVRKQPTQVPRLDLSAYTGQWSRHGAMLDAAGPLDAQGHLRGRFVAEQRHEGDFRAPASHRHATWYGMLQADIGPDTTIGLGASRQDGIHHDSWANIPTAPDGSDLGLPRSTYLGNAWDGWNQHTTTTFARLEHRLASGWHLRLDTLRIRSSLDYLGSYLSGGAPDNMRYSLGQYRYNSHQSSHALTVIGNFNALGRKHELAFGAGQRRFTAQGQGLTVFDYQLASGIGMDVRGWSPYRVPRPEPGSLTLNPYAYRYSPSSDTTQQGAWLLTRLNLGARSKLLLGARLDWYRQHSLTQDSLSAQPTDLSISHHLTRYAALVREIDALHSLYANASEIFQPRTERDGAGRLLPPSEGRTYAAGLLGSYLDGRLNAGLHLFSTEQAHQPELLYSQGTCPGYPVSPCYRASGRIRSQGLELEVQGSPAPAWQIAASHTVTRSRAMDSADNQSQPFEPQLPRRQTRLSAIYRLPHGLGGPWRIGASLYRQSTIYSQGDDPLSGWQYRIHQPAYTLLGLMVSFQPSPHLNIQLNIHNLLDRRYYQSIQTPTFTVYGAPRNAVLTAQYRF